MNSAPAAAGLLVRNPREQNQVVLSSRTSVGWRENSDIWKTTGVPDSAKHQYVHQHLPQCGKALKVVQRGARFAKARPRCRAGTCYSWECGKMDGLQRSQPAQEQEEITGQSTIEFQLSVAPFITPTTSLV